MLAKLSSKGQLVIPKGIRRALGLAAGAQFHVRLDEDGKIVLEPILAAPIDALYGKYPDADFLIELESEHKKEIRDEERIRP